MFNKIFNNFIDAYNALKSIWLDWDTFTPKQKWKILFKFGDLSARVIGLNFYSDLKLSRFWFLALIIVTVYYLLIVYTLIYCGINGYLVDGLPCLCAAGICISVSF